MRQGEEEGGGEVGIRGEERGEEGPAGGGGLIISDAPAEPCLPPSSTSASRLLPDHFFVKTHLDLFPLIESEAQHHSRPQQLAKM